jgi:hypothetical protein
MSFQSNFGESDGHGLFVGAAFDKGAGPRKYQNHDPLAISQKRPF